MSQVVLLIHLSHTFDMFEVKVLFFRSIVWKRFYEQSCVSQEELPPHLLSRSKRAQVGLSNFVKQLRILHCGLQVEVCLERRSWGSVRTDCFILVNGEILSKGNISQSDERICCNKTSQTPESCVDKFFKQVYTSTRD